MGNKEYDFCGWATKNDLRCSDGRTIRKNAFKNDDGKKVPLVWNHCHDDPSNVLGHALLENRDEGVYTYCSFNSTDAANRAKELVLHGDITSLSIYANHLKQNRGDVLHGEIKEVSLVLAGANPEALINSIMVHSDDPEADDEAIIYANEEVELYHSCGGKPEKKEDEEKKDKNELEHSKESSEENKENKSMDNEKTVQDVFDELTEDQKKVVYALIGMALEDKEDGNKDEGDDDMKHNLFDSDYESNNEVLSHSDMEAIFSDAKRYGSLKDSVLAHGIDDIEYLFPDDRTLNNAPDFIKREDAWVTKVMNGVHHTPFSRIKSLFANITEADARARGYIKGNRKVDEVFGLLKRSTTPTTIYKKQKLDRDDVIDITDFDVVAWLKTEMRMMLNEEIARAILVGDGRQASSDDKINEQNIRPIWTDDELYTIKQVVTVTSDTTADQKAKAFIRAAVKARKNYKGSGSPTLYTTEDVLTDCLLMEDSMGRVIYDSADKLATALRVKEIVTVPVMENLTRNVDGHTNYLWGIIVNLNDYNVGADKGGNVNMFDDFDIDYNAQKYLIETRCSGALTKPYSAIAIEMSFNAVLEVEPEDGTTTVLGKTVSTVQDDILIHDDFITGTLKYVTNWTAYSQDPDEKNGNFLVLKVEASDGATTTLNFVGESRVVTFDSDMQAVVRVTGKKNKKIRIASTVDGVTVEKIYSLSALNLETA